MSVHPRGTDAAEQAQKVSLDELRALVGQELGVGDWVTITQEQVNAFADLTGDHQYIHVDPERAVSFQFSCICCRLRSIRHGPLHRQPL